MGPTPAQHPAEHQPLTRKDSETFGAGPSRGGEVDPLASPRMSMIPPTSIDRFTSPRQTFRAPTASATSHGRSGTSSCNSHGSSSPEVERKDSMSAASVASEGKPKTKRMRVRTGESLSPLLRPGEKTADWQAAYSASAAGCAATKRDTRIWLITAKAVSAARVAVSAFGVCIRDTPNHGSESFPVRGSLRLRSLAFPRRRVKRKTNDGSQCRACLLNSLECSKERPECGGCLIKGIPCVYEVDGDVHIITHPPSTPLSR